MPLARQEEAPHHVATEALWETDRPATRWTPLGRDLEVDVVVIGAGVTGLSAALRLARAGRSVAVLDRHRIGQGATGQGSAHVTALLDHGYFEIQAKHGREGAARVWSAAREAVDRVEALARESGEDVGFARVTEYLWAADERQREDVRREYEALASLGAPVELPGRTPLPFEVRSALCVRGQARVHPQRYLAALARMCEAAGVQIYEDTGVVAVEDGEPCAVHTATGNTVRAGFVLLATHTPLTRFALQARCAPYTSYAVAFPGRAVPDILACDRSDPYYFVCTHSDGARSWWVAGGRDHRTGQGGDTRERFDELVAWCEARFGVRDEEIAHRWTAQVIETLDGLPFIGRVPGKERLLLATGFGGTGLTWGTLGGEMIADAAMGVETPWDELFSPQRFDPFAEASRGLTEAASTGAAYMRDYLQSTEVTNFDEIPLGVGCMVRRGLKLYAGYRDERGHLTVLDAVCPHLGGVVHFNPATGTWDCPCHGSRFDTEGDVLEGPATEGLRRVGVAEVEAVEEDVGAALSD